MSARQCLRCEEPLHSLGIDRLRMGGTTGGWHFLFGELAELDESWIEVEILACRACRHMEFALADSSEFDRADWERVGEADPGSVAWDPRSGAPTSHPEPG